MSNDNNIITAAKPGQVMASQRGRASVEILAGMLRFSSDKLRNTARDNFLSQPEGARLAAEHAQDVAGADVAERVEQVKRLVNADPVYRLERFVQRYVAEEMWNRAIVNSEEKRPEIQARVAIPRQGAGGTLDLDPDLAMPDYYDGVEYHLQPGGWDGFDLYGKQPAGGNVFKYGGVAAVPVHSDIFQHRIQTISQFPKASYERVYEIGCGGVHTLAAVHAVFPQAELYGCDLSGGILVNGHDNAERMGLQVHLKQRDARHTGEPDASVDGVLSYALHHEAPIAVNVEIFREVFRMLKPGGDFVIQDPPPFRAVDAFHAAVLDWDTENREEPYFTETCLANWDEELRAIGFVDVSSYALGPGSYPWITRASKPA
ncbi:MAG: class I SAM-dependent methyltransferase [Pseudomonadota bacterium]